MKNANLKNLILFFFLSLGGMALAQTTPDTLNIRRGALQLKSGATTNIGLKLRFFEASNQTGNNYFELRAPRSLAGNVSMILPAIAPSPGDFLSAVTADSFGWNTEAKKISWDFSIKDTVKVNDSLFVAEVPFAVTIDSIVAATNTGTATLYFDYREHATRRTRGTNIETGGMIADDFEVSTTFDDSTIPANSPIFCRVTAVSGGAQNLWVTIFARKT